ncbi:siderophore-iron reductase FhuF [Methylobacterium gregans]|uniref:Ferric iron reductase protein FhuF n=1 Tax=Methylobacterium gregans TaxID=374424 RepID=A0AA37MBC8_9HYPH|nr:siderophore-iron reductase FhuF [Methylobacterium gregans]MDQ0519592.1 ferric iron reductase protein FhuF [Methylobacterium gregans]GJD79710.1 Ferric iron reductase protein FhuF [Methylobacterium gregans]GLS52764.1 transporter [Methylobacterium gregans]
MIEEVSARVPESLAAYRGGVAAGPGGPDARPLASLRDPAVFDATLAAFGAGVGASSAGLERRALVSYWSQFYLAALATPALTALVRLGRPLPLAFERTSLELDAAGRPARLLVDPATGRGGSCLGAAQVPQPGLAGLVEDHLRPFVELCCAQCGLAPRVIWGNAAVILDYVAGELGAGDAPACAEVAACLGRPGGCACARTPLAQALCAGAAGCRRRTCCLRSRLPGVPSCGALCPLERCAEP